MRTNCLLTPMMCWNVLVAGCAVLVALSCPTTAQLSYDCVIPPGHTNGELVVPSEYEPASGKICNDTSELVQTITNECANRYCDPGTGPCTCDRLDLLSSNNGIRTRISCWVQVTRRRYYKYVCCAGYEDDSGNCVKIIDCSDNNGGCAQLCIRAGTKPGVTKDTCACNPGYNKVGRTECADIDECLVNNGGCDTFCTNTQGSFVCSCMPGYRVGPDRKTCQDVNECDLKNGGCQVLCNNKLGSFECLCPLGNQLADDRQTCQANPTDAVPMLIPESPQAVVATPSTLSAYAYYGIGGGVAFIILLLLLLLLLLLCLRRRRRAAAPPSDAFANNMYGQTGVVVAEEKKIPLEDDDVKKVPIYEHIDECIGSEKPDMKLADKLAKEMSDNEVNNNRNMNVYEELPGSKEKL